MIFWCYFCITKLKYLTGSYKKMIGKNEQNKITE